MVDINLFKDEDDDELERKPDEEMDMSLDDLESELSDTGLSDSDLSDDDLVDEDLGDTLDFEEDDLADFDDKSFAGKEDAGGGADLLDDEFGALPEDEAEEETVDESDYNYGDGRKKKTPVWVWALFGLFVVAAFLYLFVLQPASRGIKTVSVTPQPAQTSRPALPVPADTAGGGQAEAADSVAAAGIRPETDLEKTASDMTAPEAAGSKTAYANSTVKVLADLSAAGQFGAVLLSGDNFAAVQYVSASPGAAEAMGNKIKQLLGATSVKTSPEERHRTDGKVYYYGVVSGTLPSGGPDAAGRAGNQSYDAFSREIKNMIRQHGLKLTDIQKLHEKTTDQTQQTDVRIKIEGSKAAVTAFLPGMSRLPGNVYITKLFLTPSGYTDFKAGQLKLVLEFRLIGP